MKDATFMIPKPSLLQEAVALLDEINIGERPDIQGDIYEHLLGELKTAGRNGQFRTPRHIIRMMVDLARAISKVNLKKIVHALTHRLFEM
jgi:type I restriction enzyme M protein